jgi:MerR family transcriptional regulator, light-induced transcriptional regulator
MPAQYPIRAVAKLTGITIDTLRAWERRYNAVTPGRSDRGRLYDDADIRRLVLLRSAVERGHAIGQVAALSDAELRELADTLFTPASVARHEVDKGLTSLRPELQPVLEAIQAFDYTAANGELGRLALLSTVRDLVHKVVLPLMHEAGELWENGKFQIAHEHMLSACVRNLLGGMLRLQDPGRRAPRMLLTTPAGELHEFGILAAGLLAVGQQFQVSYLGPNLPAREVLFAAMKNAPQVVVLGITKVNATPVVREDVRQIVEALPADVELWLGGDGAVEVFNGSARSGVHLIRDLVEFEGHLLRLKDVLTKESPG